MAFEWTAFLISISCFLKFCWCRDIALNPKSIIPINYVKEYRPQPPWGGPVIVNFTIFIHDVSTVSAVNMDFRIDMFLTQSWQDWRLEIPYEVLEDGEDYLILPTSFLDNMWQPQPYIKNAKSSEIMSLTQQFSGVTLYYNKTIHYNVRLSVVVGCQMEFRQYPVDIQKCPITLETFSYDDKKVKFQWANAIEPITLNPRMQLLQFGMNRPIPTESRSTTYADRPGQYSQLLAWFIFERYIGYHLIQVFFPSFLIVALSWFSFYMGLDAVPGRASLLITTFLALITMFSGVKADLPAVSYVKAIDIWMAVCMLFLFGAMTEFIAVKFLDHIQKSHQIKLPKPIMETQILPQPRTRPRPRRLPLGVSTVNGKVQNGGDSVPVAWSENGLHSRRRVSRLQMMMESIREYHDLIDKIECQSRYLFPLSFGLFALIYWPLLLFRKI